MNENKTKAVDAVIQNIKKQYGEGSVFKLGDTPEECDALPTGILPLDIAIGIGGIPKGRIIEIYGPEAAGKTMITLQCIAETQRDGGICAFIDAEHALNTQFAENIGVDTDSLIVSQPDYGEQALEIAEQLVRSGGIDLIVVDSVAALVPKSEIDGEMGDQQVGLQARMMSKAMRKLTAVVSKTNTTIIFINQLREKVGIMFGNPEVTTGGKALKFYSSLRLDVRKIQQIKKNNEVIGNRIKVKIVKNKVAAPFKEAEFDLIFASGVDNEGCIVDIATNQGIIEKAGAWYSYQNSNGEKIIHTQGRDATVKILKDDKILCDQILDKVKKKIMS